MLLSQSVQNTRIFAKSNPGFENKNNYSIKLIKHYVWLLLLVATNL